MNDLIDMKANNENQKLFLGIEFGSTRIKALLIDENHTPVASGSHEWENQLENGIWTYSLDAIWAGLQDCYRKLNVSYAQKKGEPLHRVDGMGFSAMMHGYMAFDKAGTLLTPFRTWRNTTTAQAAEELSREFSFNIPQRWSAAHLYQAILNGEAHVGKIAYLTTLAGYIHWQLTGRKVIGIGDASGMFPIDSAANDFDSRMLARFDELCGQKGVSLNLHSLLPKVLTAGTDAGELTISGAKLFDPDGYLQPGIPLCPPEGDAGTGMVATNSIAERTCNVSAGTSIFAMAVLEKPLSKMYPEIDMVTTPTGRPVAMVHANTCTSDLDAWMDLFQQVLQTLKAEVDQSTLYESLFHQALSGDPDCGGLLAYNFFSGEPVASVDNGAPLFVRTPESRFNLANFMRVQIFSALGTLQMGMDILFDQEKVTVDQVLGHGGFFKTKEVGQRVMTAAMRVPVSVMATAGEGGAFGIALLAAFRVINRDGLSLEEYLRNYVFAGADVVTLQPDNVDVSGFETFMRRYRQGLEIERTAVSILM
jgi:sugar (pentulose or hexulose) kinase